MICDETSPTSPTLKLPDAPFFPNFIKLIGGGRGMSPPSIEHSILRTWLPLTVGSGSVRSHKPGRVGAVGRADGRVTCSPSSHGVRSVLSAESRAPRVFPREPNSLLQANITTDHRSQITENRRKVGLRESESGKESMKSEEKERPQKRKRALGWSPMHGACDAWRQGCI